ncbi:hypothetical protein DL766_000929 [Monosporascus sp. MC13-8B]|uniref:Uncharacterized protein n=1 Tax=Monosporascus cannonballus TaxID=155416 RepID=A0ABY0HB15_9PEZI|nr:hypothetical protein DL762_003315 [Monosporascus cannonballus]RYP38512.1 hypothetical protein DL766_000929 [Monosporascus sp. MC13-8B]
MPVTTKPSPSRVGKNQDRTVDVTDENLSRRVFDIVTEDCHSPYENDPRWPKLPEGGRRPFHYRSSAFKDLPFIASSFDNKSSTSTEATRGFIAPYENGFVDGLIRAFNQDLHLVVRPDDVWQAIISQFSLFVNGHAERLRHLFVSHEGRRTLTADLAPFDLSDIDLGKMALEFASIIQANVVDAEMRQWMLPGFSTTTDHDKAVAAFGMMGALQKYFEYHMLCGCGLPSVTLLGERADWAELARRVEKLPRYGEECARWAELLRPVMRHMLLTFDVPESQEVKDFWLRAVHEAGIEGSGWGIRTLSGWITAFAYFQENGNVTKDFDEEYLRTASMPPYGGYSPSVEERKRLILDGVSYPLMGRRCIPRSVVVLPMTIRDLKTRVDRFTTVIAGSVGMSVSADSTTTQPVSAWWVVQEFEEAIEAKAQLKPGSSVAGSTTEGNSETSSELWKNFEDSNGEDTDVEFDECALP